MKVTEPIFTEFKLAARTKRMNYSESPNNPTSGSVAHAATQKDARIDEVSTGGVILFTSCGKSKYCNS